MLKNFKLIIEYDGTAYHGWQKQASERTIQAEIEKAIEKMTAQRVILTGSGRTDAGVHARGQVANFLCETGLRPQNFEMGLTSILPEDIIIRSCQSVDNKFHARFHATSKVYRYRILNTSIPAGIGRQYSWYIRRELDLEAMRRAIQYIVGEHDFKAFEAAGSPRSHTVRRVIKADLLKKKYHYRFFDIEANGFLRFMVRNIVGTLVDTGLSKITPEDFQKVLLSRDRRLAGATAPPNGLFLMEVKYG